MPADMHDTESVSRYSEALYAWMTKMAAKLNAHWDKTPDEGGQRSRIKGPEVIAKIQEHIKTMKAILVAPEVRRSQPMCCSWC